MKKFIGLWLLVVSIALVAEQRKFDQKVYENIEKCDLQ